MSDNIQQQKNVQKYGHQFRKDLRITCMRLLSYAGFLKFSELAIYTCSLKRFDISIFYHSYLKNFRKKYKTDVYREGRGVDISKHGTITCPVNMLTVISK